MAALKLWAYVCGFSGVHLCFYGTYMPHQWRLPCAGQMPGERGHVNRHAPAPPFKRQKEEEEEEAEAVRRGVKKKKKKKPQCLVKACSLTQSLSLSASQGAR